MSRKPLHQLYAEHTGKVSDKWSLYLSEYERLFDYYRDKSVCLLEIGIQNGGSLEIWSKYFNNALSLIGCDINSDCACLTYDDQRIDVIVGDANAPKISKQVFQRCAQFDLIIDDGSHLSGDIIKSFALYFPQLAKGGLFIVEDLHCSYWSQFGGGLFDPYSSISFFKLLADVINHEHWGVPKMRADILRGVFKNYGCELDERILSQVHSIEFINSMCVVRKEPASDNGLGVRVVAGSLELVVPGLPELRNLPYRLDPAFDQTANPCSGGDLSTGEALLEMEQALAHERLQSEIKEQALAHERLQSEIKEQKIAALTQEVGDMRNSISWRITAPLRFIMRLVEGKKLPTTAVLPTSTDSEGDTHD